MSNVVEILVKGKDQSAGRTLDNTATKTKKLGDAQKEASGKVKLMAAAGGLLALKLGKDAVKAASDLNESANAVTQVFGPFSGRMADAAKNASKAGLSQREFNEAITPLGALLKNSGMPMKDVADNTLKLTSRAEDMASVFNTSVPEALEAIQAGLRGESDPLEKYGVSLTQAKIQAEAMAETHKKAAKDLTSSEMATARLNLIMKQTKDTEGDFARTSGGVANQQRILSAEWENAQASLGTLLLPALTKVANVLTTKVVPGIQSAVGWMRDHKAAVSEFATVIGSLALAFGVYKVIKKTTDSIKALNIAMKANPLLTIVAALVMLATWFVLTYKRSEDFRNKVHGVLDNLSHAWDNVNHALDNVKHAWDNVWHAGKNVVQFFQDAVHYIKTAALNIGIAFFTYLLDPFLTVVGAIIHGAASAFGWVPGIGGKLKRARADFDNFRKGADRALHGMKADLNTENAKFKATNLQRTINGLRGKTLRISARDDASSVAKKVKAAIDALRNKQISIQTYVQQVILPTAQASRRSSSRTRGDAAGGVFTDRHYATGGAYSRAGTGSTFMNEQGGEVVRLPNGSMIYSHPDSERLMGGAGGVNITFEVASSGHAFDRFMLEWIRRNVRIIGGGNVQVAFGRGGH